MLHHKITMPGVFNFVFKIWFLSPKGKDKPFSQINFSVFCFFSLYICAKVGVPIKAENIPMEPDQANTCEGNLSGFFYLATPAEF